MTVGQFVKQSQCLWLRTEGGGKVDVGRGVRVEGKEDVFGLRRPDVGP